MQTVLMFELMPYYFFQQNSSAIYNRTFLIPSSRKQKKARKSRVVDMLSDIENVDVMLGGNQLERDESETSNYGRRLQSPSYGTLLNQNSNSHPNSHETEIKTYAQNGQNSREVDSSSDCNRLSGGLNQRIPRKMSTVSCQIQRAINEAISDQILPPIEASLKFGQGICLKEDGKTRLEDRNTDLKKPWTLRHHPTCNRTNSSSGRTRPD